MITRLTISGMLSIHSVRAVYTALGGVAGITRADVRMGQATVEHDGRATPDALSGAVALAGCAVTECIQERRQLPLL